MRKFYFNEISIRTKDGVEILQVKDIEKITVRVGDALFDLEPDPSGAFETLRAECANTPFPMVVLLHADETKITKG